MREFRGEKVIECRVLSTFNFMHARRLKSLNNNFVKLKMHWTVGPSRAITVG